MFKFGTNITIIYIGFQSVPHCSALYRFKSEICYYYSNYLEELVG